MDPSSVEHRQPQVPTVLHLRAQDLLDLLRDQGQGLEERVFEAVDVVVERRVAKQRHVQGVYELETKVTFLLFSTPFEPSQ